jgi:hypothetical protein
MVTPGGCQIEKGRTAFPKWSLSFAKHENRTPLPAALVCRGHRRRHCGASWMLADVEQIVGRLEAWGKLGGKND